MILTEEVCRPVDVVSLPKQQQPDAIALNAWDFDDDFVISRFRDGSVEATFSDDTWTFSCYASSRINNRATRFDIFRPISGRSCEVIKRDLKTLYLLMLYRSVRSLGTLRGFHSSLHAIARFAWESDISLSQALSSTSFVMGYTSGLSDKQGFSRTCLLMNLVIHINRVARMLPTSYPFRVPSAVIKQLIKERKRTEDAGLGESIQTPVIPTRIYSEFLFQSSQLLRLYQSVQSDIEQVYTARAIEREKYINDYAQKQARKKTERQWKVIASKTGCNSYAELNSFVVGIRDICMMLVMAYTGMRISEARSVPFNAWREERYGEHTVAGFDSYTYKLEGGIAKKEFWVSCDYSGEINAVAQSVAHILIKHIISLPMPEVESRTPLFPIAKKANKNIGALFDIGVSYTDAYVDAIHSLANPKAFILTEDDMEEVLALDPFAQWDGKKNIAVGKPWPFAPHQFRRSLIVYGVRAGVSLAVLQTNTKHTYQQQTAYYGKNSVWAKDFLAQKGKASGLLALSRELQEEEVDLQVSLIDSVIVRNERTLFGGQGAQIQKSKNEDDLPIIFADTEQTEKAIRNGDLRIAKGPAGWCMASKPCDKLAFSVPVPCVGCGDTVFDDDSVEILEDQIAIFQERIDKFGEGPFTNSDRDMIKKIQAVLESRNNLIPLKDTA